MNSIWLYACVSLVGVFFASVSQVMLKKAAMKKYDSLLAEYCNPLVIFAYIIFLGTTLVSVFAYKGMPLSLGPVLETTAYFYVTLFGVLIFKEKLNRKKVIALVLIVSGILVYALG